MPYTSVTATVILTKRFDTFVANDFNGFVNSFSDSLEDEVGMSFVTLFKSEWEEVLAVDFRKELGEPGSLFEVEILVIRKTTVVVMAGKSKFDEDDFQQVKKTLARVRGKFPHFDGQALGP